MRHKEPSISPEAESEPDKIVNEPVELILKLEGRTKDELWDNLNSLVMAAYHSKKERGEWPDVVGEYGRGLIRIQ